MDDLLALLSRRLPEPPSGEQPRDVRLLAGDQLLITRGLLARTDPAGEGGKADTYRPGFGGYQIHIAHRTLAQQTATEARAQRFTVPAEDRDPPADPHTARLHLDGTEEHAEWALSDGAGGVLTLSVTCGSARVTDEVNAILRTVAEVLRG